MVLEKAILLLSGGIDSALTASIAVDALGKDNVSAVFMPSEYTSGDNVEDTTALAENLGIELTTIPIHGIFKEHLKSIFPSSPISSLIDNPGVTEQNIQARIRGTILMAISNKTGRLLLTTGNKSELAVGYCTLYGDMNGGYNPIKDLYKMQVYRLSDWRNHHCPWDCKGPTGTVIPQNIIDKAPSAELRPNQTDQDSLPPYPVLDDILECLVEKEMAVDDIVARGHDRELVHKVEHLLYIAEYKRRQSAPGVKITRKNFGRDRRYPITNRFRDRS